MEDELHKVQTRRLLLVRLVQKSRTGHTWSNCIVEEIKANPLDTTSKVERAVFGNVRKVEQIVFARVLCKLLLESEKIVAAAPDDVNIQRTVCKYGPAWIIQKPLLDWKSVHPAWSIGTVSLKERRERQQQTRSGEQDLE